MTEETMHTAPGYLMECLSRYIPESTEAAVENAIAIYKAASAEQDAYDAVKAEAKRILAEIIAETGQMKHVTKAGTAQVTAPGVTISYNTKALDALLASDDNRARILAPPRSVKERAGTLTIM